MPPWPRRPASARAPRGPRRSPRRPRETPDRGRTAGGFSSSRSGNRSAAAASFDTASCTASTRAARYRLPGKPPPIRARLLRYQHVRTSVPARRSDPQRDRRGPSRVAAVAICSAVRSWIGSGAPAELMDHTLDPSGAAVPPSRAFADGRRCQGPAGAHPVERIASAQRAAPGSAALPGRGDARGARRPVEGLHRGDRGLRSRRQLRRQLRPRGPAGGAAAAQRPRQLLCRRRQPRPGADHDSQGRIRAALRVAGRAPPARRSTSAAPRGSGSRRPAPAPVPVVGGRRGRASWAALLVAALLVAAAAWALLGPAGAGGGGARAVADRAAVRGAERRRRTTACSPPG